MNREELLKAAIERVQAGSKEYGKVEDNFAMIAAYWNEYILGRQDYTKSDLFGRDGRCRHDDPVQGRALRDRKTED